MPLTNTSSINCHPGGMLMPGRSYLGGASSYRFGFNGKENDNEIKGVGNSQDYGMRFYDPRVVRFMSVDPLTKKYPWYSPYQFAGNMLISCIDIDGLEPATNNIYLTKFYNRLTKVTSYEVERIDPIEHKDGSLYKQDRLIMNTKYTDDAAKTQSIEDKYYIPNQFTTPKADINTNNPTKTEITKAGTETEEKMIEITLPEFEIKEVRDVGIKGVIEKTVPGLTTGDFQRAVNEYNKTQEETKKKIEIKEIIEEKKAK